MYADYYYDSRLLSTGNMRSALIVITVFISSSHEISVTDLQQADGHGGVSNKKP